MWNNFPLLWRHIIGAIKGTDISWETVCPFSGTIRYKLKSIVKVFVWIRRYINLFLINIQQDVSYAANHPHDIQVEATKKKSIVWRKLKWEPPRPPYGLWKPMYFSIINEVTEKLLIQLQNNLGQMSTCIKLHSIPFSPCNKKWLEQETVKK